MSIRKNTLWRIPAYCIAAGLIVSRLVLPVFYPSTFMTMPDGSVKMDLNKQVILYGIIFAITLLIGWLLFRRMARREIFWSAAILVAFHLLILLLCRMIQPTPAFLNTVFLNMVQTWEWSGFISVFSSWLGMSASFGSLAPFLFVFFGAGSLIKTDP